MLELLQSILKIDQTLIIWAQNWGPYLYLILFLIIFCETGVVFLPFLPGDSLLFAVGALASNPDFLKIEYIIPLLIVAAVTGDSTNYFIGKNFGRSLFDRKILFLKPSYLYETEHFFKKKGQFAVTLARFFPIIRTMAPFFAGISLMSYKKFISYSIVGSIIWVFTFCLLGYYFGQIPFIKENFMYMVLGIVIFSVLPLIKSFIQNIIRK